jgi:hypothetical protein
MKCDREVLRVLRVLMVQVLMVRVLIVRSV